jgi:pimeloyl-ACP methyl ester carboxylesterase
MQTDLLRLSSDSRRAVVPGAGHHIQWDRPDAVVEEVRAMVARVREPGS